MAEVDVGIGGTSAKDDVIAASCVTTADEEDLEKEDEEIEKEDDDEEDGEEAANEEAANEEEFAEEEEEEDEEGANEVDNNADLDKEEVEESEEGHGAEQADEDDAEQGAADDGEWQEEEEEEDSQAVDHGDLEEDEAVDEEQVDEGEEEEEEQQYDEDVNEDDDNVNYEDEDEEKEDEDEEKEDAEDEDEVGEDDGQEEEHAAANQTTTKSSNEVKQDVWPPPQATKRHWGARGRALAQNSQDDQTQVERQPDKKTKGARVVVTPEAPKELAQTQKEEKAEVARLNGDVKHLEHENKALRMEIGQERFKVQQLSKLREQAAAAHRNELLARKNESEARRDLQETKKYVERRNDFVTSEKAELMQQVKSLERIVKDLTDRECCLQEELHEAKQFHGGVAEHVDDAYRDAERWKKEAVEQAAKLKRADLRVQQLEQKRVDDKAKIKALADQLRAAVGKMPRAEEAAHADRNLSSPIKGDNACLSKAGGSHPSQPGRRHDKEPLGSLKKTADVDTPSKTLTQFVFGRPSADSKTSHSRSNADLGWRQWLVGPFGRQSAEASNRKPRRTGTRTKTSDDALDEAVRDRAAAVGQQKVIAALVMFIFAMACAKLHAS